MVNDRVNIVLLLSTTLGARLGSFERDNRVVRVGAPVVLDFKCGVSNPERFEEDLFQASFGGTPFLQAVAGDHHVRLECG